LDDVFTKKNYNGRNGIKMKRLFSPWRSVYIRSFQSDKKLKECLFCRIAKEDDDKKNLVVWRGKECFIVMNRYPYNNGHVMVVPYMHTSSMAKLTDKTNMEVMKTTARCIQALYNNSKPDGFNFGANLGRVAGAGIDQHIHFHLVPRWSGDTNFMPVLSETKIISEDISKTWKLLKSELKKKK
jgi:ATP adenylyltransferase